MMSLDDDGEQGGEAYVHFETAAAKRRRTGKVRGKKPMLGVLAGRYSLAGSCSLGDKTGSGLGQAQGGDEGEGGEGGGAQAKSLVELTRELKEDPEFEEKKRIAEEQRFMETIKSKQKALLSAEEKAAGGTRFKESLVTGWTPRKRVRDRPTAKHVKVLKKFHILVEGPDVPPPCCTFQDMRLPKPVIQHLKGKGITKPTPIQIQGLPVALSGRDMIGIAFTGSGKTLTFSLPMVLMAIGEEMKTPIIGGEGPFGVILGPSRELMTQTFELVEELCGALHNSSYPKLHPALVIGGLDKREQIAGFRAHGCHMVVATPGRLNDFLQRGDLNLDLCRYFCLDEGDRMVSDDGFEDELQRILGYCKVQRQTLLFSATMPKKIVDFAQSSLIRPVTVNVGRAGAANLDIIQEVEFVNQESKIVYLLQALQKSPPPVVIFCDSKKEADDIYEYLLLKGVDAVAIHGGKEQADRNEAIQAFKRKEKDVLVATDVAAKGLDFPNIQHVINFNMPTEMENYVHRIGRTGRSGRTGIATTFVNNSSDASTLLDLKHLLKEAKQKVPTFLEELEDPFGQAMRNAVVGVGVQEGDECGYCGGLGHSTTTCPRLQTNLRAQQAKSRDVVGGAAYGGNW
mmetsp:Transcript_7844/g.14413  ORF Transcript_7844/g.14413 Transcript_7844/m.14413 type:complete len:626 (+) Transcript_7844:221-2098(+)